MPTKAAQAGVPKFQKCLQKYDDDNGPKQAKIAISTEVVIQKTLKKSLYHETYIIVRVSSGRPADGIG